MAIQAIKVDFDNTTVRTESRIVVLKGIKVTKREQEVLQMMSEGLTVKEMAVGLYLSHHTILSHKKNLVEKFSARNSVDLMVKAIRLGCIDV